MIATMISPIIKGHLDNLYEANSIDIDSKLVPSFEEALSELSTDNPVLAFYLRGQEKLEMIAQVSKRYTDEIPSTVLDNESPEWVGSLVEDLSKSQYIDFLSSLSKNLTMMSYYYPKTVVTLLIENVKS
ncbi:hypothetical protein [Aliamphritea spongicola]|nr:hypothetical protein [Aliamphritea spongicola]